MGILPPRGVLRVWEIPWRRYICRSVARSLPMVAGLICRRSLRVSSSIGRCPWVTRFVLVDEDVQQLLLAGHDRKGHAPAAGVLAQCLDDIKGRGDDRTRKLRNL